MKRSIFILVFLSLILSRWNNSLSISGLDWDDNILEISHPAHLSEDFLILGPDELCIYFGSVIGEFFGGGRSTDVFRWRLVGSDGSIIVEREGGFQTFSHTFSEPGDFEIQLTVRRGINEVFSGSKSIKVNQGADLVLEPSYLLCEDGTATLTLINPNESNIDSYQIEWSDSSGGIVGSGNSIVVDKPDLYTVDFFTLFQEVNEFCQQRFSTHVYIPRDFSIDISTSQVCNTGTDITVSATQGVFGVWYFQKEGSNDKKLLGEGNNLVFRRNNLDGPGDYQIIFEVDNSINQFCKLEDFVPLTVTVAPSFQFYFESGAESCESDDGVLVILPNVDLDYVQLSKDNRNLTRYFDLKHGVELRIPGMKSGIYRASGAVSSCTSGRTAIVPLENLPSDLDFSIDEVIGESCNDTGRVEGIVKIKMLEDKTGRSFSVYSTGRAVPFIFREPINGNEFQFSISSGNYFIEVFNEEGCVNPHPTPITIQSKGQVSFTSPNRITVCETFDFIPNTSEDLIFTLTYPDNSTEVKKSGEAFVLDREGSYTLIGLDAELDRAFCPKESTFEVFLTTPVQFEPELVLRDCFGNLQYKANLFGADPGRVDIKWYNEKNQIVGNDLFLFPTSFGEFKLEVQPRNSESCPKPPKSFIVNEPILKMDVLVEAEPLCGDNFSAIKISNESENIGTIEWIFFDIDGNALKLVAFENQLQIEVDNPGVYEAVIYNDLDCEIGRRLVTVIETSELALFEVPEEIVVCDFFELDPETPLGLKYQVLLPDGSELVFGSGESLLLDQNGTYTITSSSLNHGILLCPVTKSILVKKSSSVNFEPELYEQDCEGGLVFQAMVVGSDLSEVDVFWYNELGDLVGQEEFLTPQSFGEYSLEVRPKGSEFCPQPNTKIFEVIKPIVELNGGLTVTPFCPDDENVTITLEAELNQVYRINWYFTGLNGNKQSLDMFDNLGEITVSEQGTYEVEAFNEINCLLGKDMVIVMKSMDDIRPEVESVYAFCSKFGDNITINPGNFDAYQWYMEGDLVSEDPVFIPMEVGNYSLTVSSFEGCQYSTEFLVKETCELMVQSTTGMKVNDVKNPFMVYTNSLVDRLDIWIYNNWGQLIYSCSKDNLYEGERNCIWYGDFNGGYIQPGTYSVKISVKNVSESKPKNIFRSLMVIE
ncbi:hypothetical protein [Aquiflexum sp.]|uniref:hypothetical protein n=1 Tax=Aquiflexum sp. TaxID=1872584 RepID=UPI003593AD00